MKNQPLFFLLAIWLCCSSLIAQGIQQHNAYSLQPTVSEGTASPTAAVSQITASEYCTFLNAVAATGQRGLYDEKMGSKLEDRCILRSGSIGNYSYSVIQEKQNTLIPFLSWLNAMRYCNWLENGSITSFERSEDIDVTEHGSYELQDDQLISINPDAIYLVESASGCDLEFRSSSLTFHIINTTDTSSLAKTSSGGSGKDTSWEEKVAGISIGVGMIFDGEEHIAEVASGDGAIAPVEAKASITDASSKRTQINSSLGKSVSPLMMFGGGTVEEAKAPEEAKIDPRQTQDPRLTTSTTTSSGQLQRSTTTTGISENSSSDEESVVDDESINPAIRRGGLSNNRADCFINSSLQLCKAFKEQLNPEALAQMPSLSHFLNEGLSTDEECRLLRHEMATEVIKDDQDLQRAVQEGTAQTHQDAAAFLRLLLAETRAPNLSLEERLENSVTGETRIEAARSQVTLQLALPPDQGNAIAIRDVIQNELHSTREQRWIDEDITSPVVQVRRQLNVRNDSIPPILVVSLGRFGFDGHGVKNKIKVNRLKERIILPAANGEQVTYEPTAIICHIGDTLEVGHYVCYRKENGAWLLFNDNKDVAVPVALEGTFAPKNCSVISYRRVLDGDPDKAIEMDASGPTTAPEVHNSNTRATSSQTPIENDLHEHLKDEMKEAQKEISEMTSGVSLFLSQKLLPSTLSSKEEVGEAIRRMVFNQSFDLDSYYKGADVHWESAAAAWNERAQANKKIKITSEQKKSAQQALEQAEKETTPEELRKTILGRIAQYSSDAATKGVVIAGGVAVVAPFTGPGAPFVLAGAGVITAAAGTSETVSKIAEKANHIWATGKKLIAQRTAQNAEEEHDSATQKLAAIKETTPQLEQAAQGEERNAWIGATKAKRSLTALLHPPTTSLHDTAWEEWGERISQEGKGALSWKEALVREGKNDPFWVAQTIEMALRERMARDLREHEEKKGTAIQQQEQLLSQAEIEYERKKEKMEEALEKTNELSQKHERLKHELERLNSELDGFESRHEDAQYQRGMYDAWEAAKKALCDTFEQAATTAKELYEKEKELRQRKEKFRKAEIKASFADSNYTQTKKTLARKEARLLGKEESVTEWQLPCFLREETTVATHQSSSKQDSIEPPERFDNVWESLGKRLKEQEERKEQRQAAQVATASSSSLEDQKQENLPIEAPLETTPILLKEAILLFLEGDYQKNPGVHQARWEARRDLENKIKEKDLAVAATQRNSQRETARASFAAVPSQSSYRRNLFDLMNTHPRKAIISEASETASVSDTSSQTGSTIDIEAYQVMTTAARTVDTAQVKLDQLIWDAEKIRSGEEAPPPNETLASEWEKADEELQNHLKEQGERLQEIAFRAQEEKNWKNNLKRWESINEIEGQEEELKAARKKVRDLIKLKDPNWKTADSEVKACEKALKESQEKWTVLAIQEENICLLKDNGADEATLQTARNELQKTDRRINELGKKVRTQYQAGGLKEEEVLQKFLDSLSLSEKEKSTVGIWIAQLKREERASEERRSFAAERYFDGDKEHWKKLTVEEQSKYNQPIREANKARQEKKEQELREAQEEAEKTKIRSDRYNSDSLSSQFQRARYPASKPPQLLKEAQDAMNNLNELKAQQSASRELIAWAQLSPDQRKMRQAQRKAQLAEENAKKASELGYTTAAGFQEQIARALEGDRENPGVAYAYSQADYEQREGATQAAKSWRKIAQDSEAQVAALTQQITALASQAAALARGDTKAANLQGHIASVLGGGEFILGVVSTYRRASYEQKKGNREEAKSWRKAAQDSEAQVAALTQEITALASQTAALARGDTKTAELQGQITEALGSYDDVSLPGVACAYREAAYEQRKGNAQAAEAWHKIAQDREAQVAALTQQIAALASQAAALARGDTKAANLQEKIGEAWGGSNSNPGAVYAYSQAAYEQRKGNAQAAEAWRKASQAHEAQAEALSKGDTAAAELHNQAARALGGNWKNPGAAYAYNQAHENNNPITAEDWRKAAQVYEAQATALARNNTKAEELQKKIARALGGNKENPGAAYAYIQAAYTQRKGHEEVAEAWRESAQAYEAQATALAQRDTKTAELQGKFARALGGYGGPGAVKAYRKILDEQRECNREEAELWHKVAQAHEEKAVALSQGDTKTADLQEQIAWVLEGDWKRPGAVYAYNRAAYEQKQGNTQAAKSWQKSSQAYENQAIALARRDTKEADLQEQIAWVLGGDEGTYSYILGGNVRNPGAAYAYRMAAYEQNKDNKEASESWCKLAQAYEVQTAALTQQIAALARGDTKEADLQEQIAWASGGNTLNPGAAYAYRMAVKQDNRKAADLWCKSAQAYEAQAVALSHGYTKDAELQKKIAGALGGNKYDLGAAFAYIQAGYELTVNKKAADLWYKAAQAHEAEAAALVQGNTEVAELQGKFARALGGNMRNPGAAYAYSQATTKQNTIRDTETWRKRAQEYEVRAAALEQQVEDSLKKKKEGPSLKTASMLLPLG